MKLHTIGIKLLLVSLASIVLMSVAFIVLMINGSRQMSYQLSRQHMETSVYTIDTMITQIKDNTLMTATQLANNTAIATGVQTNNATAVLTQINTAMSLQTGEQSAYLVIVTDRFGRVVARQHSNVRGDVVSHFPVVAFALNHIPMSDIEFQWETPLSIVSAAPITGFDGSVLGSVIVGYDMGSASFINTLQATTGSEIAIFAHDTSIATSLQAGSQFDVGSRIERLAGYRVLAHRNYVFAEQTILGQPFLSYYAPIMDGDGVIIGLLFMGQNLFAARQAEMSMMLIAIIAAIIIAGIALFISNLLNRRMIVNPVKQLSRDLTQLSMGNININKANNISNDEIGALKSDVYGIVDVIKSVTTDMSDLIHHVYKIGDWKFAIDASKYQNVYKEVIDGLNYIVEAESNNVYGIVDAIKRIGDGDFDIEVPDLVGDFNDQQIVIRAVLANLKSVNSEVRAMIESIVVKGDLNIKIDVDRFKGDWRNIMEGLNDIVKAVATPVAATEICLNEMKKGNFNLARVDQIIRDAGLNSDSASYKGVFYNMVSAVDTTLTEIHDYIEEITIDTAAIAQGDLTTEITRNFMGDFAPIKSH